MGRIARSAILTGRDHSGHARTHARRPASRDDGNDGAGAGHEPAERRAAAPLPRIRLCRGPAALHAGRGARLSWLYMVLPALTCGRLKYFPAAVIPVPLPVLEPRLEGPPLLCCVLRTSARVRVCPSLLRRRPAL